MAALLVDLPAVVALTADLPVAAAMVVVATVGVAMAAAAAVDGSHRANSNSNVTNETTMLV